MEDLNILFVDMNAFFASVEQQDDRGLRGRPVVVAAVLTDATCCIAASYEAKRWGIKTGTNVGVARRMCPRLIVREARPERYVEVHNRIKQAIGRCLPVEEPPPSVDEMWCRLMGRERRREQALAIARDIKRAIHDGAGDWLKCSIGVGPNRLLAKIASDMRKPDGLVAIGRGDLPQALHRLSLRDLPGIGPGMDARLRERGVTTVERLCQLPEDEMAAIWGGVVGRRWWHWLRGEEVHEPRTRHQSVGHSHVLPPELRTDEAARAVLVKLLHKAAARLRRMRYWARRMRVYVSYTQGEEGWAAEVALGCCQDTLTMVEALAALWPHCPRLGPPTQVGIDLFDLVPHQSADVPLFPEAQRRTQLAGVIDRIQEKHGPRAAYLASMTNALDSAPTRIAFSRVPEAEDFRQESHAESTAAADSSALRALIA